MGQDQGEAFRKGGENDLSNGPISKRSCTDCLFFLLFMAFLAGMVIVGIVGFSRGNPMALTHGYQPLVVEGEGTVGCGLDAAEDYPYLYFPVSTSYKKACCVKKCPQTGDAVNPFSDDKHSVVPECTGAGATAVYDSVKVFGRFCMPENVEDNAIWKKLNEYKVTNWVGDLASSYEIVIAIAGFAIVLGFFYMLLLRWCAGVMAFISIIGTIVGLVFTGYFCNFRAEKMEKGEIEGSDSTRQALVILSYVLYGLGALVALICLCLCKRIRIAIAIIKASALFVKDVWTVLMVPFIMFVITGIFYAWWVAVAVFLISSGEIKPSDAGPFATVSLDETTQYTLIYHLFGLLWVNAFLIAFTFMVIAGAAGIWYFSPFDADGSKVPQGAVRKSFWRAFRYHIGTLALGSLIIAIVQFVRICLEYIKRRTEKTQNKATKAIICCMQCCLACFERVLKFINKNAYIQTALTGHKFCRAAKDSFFLILRNCLRFAAVANIGAVFLFLGRAVISVGATFLGYMILTNVDKYDRLSSPIAPALVGFFLAFVIASTFMSVYGLGADTILQCFIADEEMNSGRAGKGGSAAEHAPEVLRQFLSEHGGEKKGCC